MIARKYTLEQDNWLRENYPISESFNELTERFNQSFTPTRSKSSIAQRCGKTLNLKGMGNEHRFTAEQVKWLQENYDSDGTYAELADQFNLYFGTKRTSSQISDKCSKHLGIHCKGTATKYGAKPKEQAPIGSVRKSQVATYIKVLEVPPKACFTGYKEPYWLPLQKKIYQDAYDVIKPGQMVCFLDGNAENFELDNLYAIDRKISAIMSLNQWWTDSKVHTLTAIKWCELHYALKDAKGDLA